MLPEIGFFELATKYAAGGVGIAGALWYASRILRRLSGLAIYAYMTGLFLVVIAGFVALGFIDVNVARFRRAGTLASELARAVSRVVGIGV